MPPAEAQLPETTRTLFPVFELDALPAVAVLHSMHTKRLTTHRTLGLTELPTDPLT
jgi:hypothetical protein